MKLVKNRDFSPTPSFWYTKDLEWNVDKHAGLYLLEPNKLGSTGGQTNATELGLFGCVCNTHEHYSKRSENKVLSVFWGCIDISLIVGGANIKDKQYDKLVQNMIIALDPRVKRDETNKDALVIKTGAGTYRKLTFDELLDYLNVLFGNGVKKQVFLPHTRQQKNILERNDFVMNNRDKSLIVNVENCHTRFGKDKNNYLGIRSETEVILVFSGYFATFQITDEFDPSRDYAVQTRGRSVAAIIEDVIIGREQQKRIWLLISTYNDFNSSRIKMLTILKMPILN